MESGITAAGLNDRLRFSFESPLVTDSSLHTECRLIIDQPAPGAWNMAVDEALLMDAAENSLATLRFYQWSEPTLSLGYFQRHADRHQHEPSRNCALVRRQTGGGAILHDRELTYSISLPAGHPLARRPQALYAAAHDAFITVIEPALAADPPRWTLLRRDQESHLAATPEPFLCFQRQAPGDVLLRATISQAAWKILGSAQRRYRGAVLQHGSLLLEKSSAAPELPGLVDLALIEVEPRQLASAVSVRLATDLDMRLSTSRFPPNLESNAEEFAEIKYGGPAWTNRR
jgi:lipoate-protein ligase A